MADRTSALNQLPIQAEYQMPLQGKAITITRKNIPLEFLKLDIMNQRLGFVMKAKKVIPTEAAVENLMWRDDYVKDLSHSIQMNGGLLQPLLVTAGGVVVEGNSRLVALRQVVRRLKADKKLIPKQIKNPSCEILPLNIGSTDLLWVLAEFHIAGKHPWNPYEQAEVIHRLRYSEKQPIDQIAKHLRMKRLTIERKLGAHELMKEYLKLHGDSPGQIGKWSYFDEVLKRPELTQKMSSSSGNYDPNFKEDLFNWIHEEKLKGENIRSLPKIIDNKKAKKIFEQKDFKAAKEYIDLVDPTEGSKVFSLITRLTQQISEMQVCDLAELADLTGIPKLNRIKIINDLMNQLKFLKDTMKNS